LRHLGCRDHLRGPSYLFLKTDDLIISGILKIEDNGKGAFDILLEGGCEDVVRVRRFTSRYCDRGREILVETRSCENSGESERDPGDDDGTPVAGNPL